MPKTNRRNKPNDKRNDKRNDKPNDKPNEKLIELTADGPRLVDDPFVTRLGFDAADDTSDPLPATGDLIVDHGRWQAQRSALSARDGRLGLYVDADLPLSAFADDLLAFDLIALDFPHFKDGRSYSKARLLRERHQFAGPLRAVGDVLYDQLAYMARCGFDQFALAPSVDVAHGLRGFEGFSVAYQPAIDQPTPLFRRVQRQ